LPSRWASKKLLQDRLFAVRTTRETWPMIKHKALRTKN
jgi:hypothetical protein